MGKRITAVLDDDLVKKLHEIQAKLVQKTQKSVSFSRVLNDLVRKGLKPKSWIDSREAYRFLSFLD